MFKNIFQTFFKITLKALKLLSDEILKEVKARF